MEKPLQTIDQFLAELAETAKHSDALGYEGVSIKLSNELALEIIEKLQNCNSTKCN